MKHLRVWTIILLVWYGVLFSMARILDPVRLAPFVSWMAVAVGLLLVGMPRFARLPLPWLCGLPLVPFFGLKLLLGYPVGGAALPFTITELCLIELTVILARQIGYCVLRFEQAVAEIMVSQLQTQSPPFNAGQADMYREIRRARVFRRPLALLAVGPRGDCGGLSVDRFIEEVQRATIDRYIAARVGHLLSEQVKDCDIIAQRNHHFVVLLPETTRSGAVAIAERVAAAARDQLGLALNLGVSSFPDEEVTFDKLLERAETEMLRSKLPATPGGAGAGGATVESGRLEGGERDLKVVMIRVAASDTTGSVARARAAASALLPPEPPGMAGTDAARPSEMATKPR